MYRACSEASRTSASLVPSICVSGTLVIAMTSVTRSVPVTLCGPCRHRRRAGHRAQRIRGVHCHLVHLCVQQQLYARVLPVGLTWPRARARGLVLALELVEQCHYEHHGTARTGTRLMVHAPLPLPAVVAPASTGSPSLFK